MGLGVGVGLGLGVGVGLDPSLQVARATAAQVLGGQGDDLVAELAEDGELERKGGELLGGVRG